MQNVRFTQQNFSASQLTLLATILEFHNVSLPTQTIGNNFDISQCLSCSLQSEVVSDSSDISSALAACWLMIPLNSCLLSPDLHNTFQCYLSVKLATHHALRLGLTSAILFGLWLSLD